MKRKMRWKSGSMRGCLQMFVDAGGVCVCVCVCSGAAAVGERDRITKASRGRRGGGERLKMGETFSFCSACFVRLTFHFALFYWLYHWKRRHSAEIENPFIWFKQSFPMRWLGGGEWLDGENAKRRNESIVFYAIHVYCSRAFIHSTLYITFTIDFVSMCFPPSPRHRLRCMRCCLLKFISFCQL